MFRNRRRNSIQECYAIYWSSTSWTQSSHRFIATSIFHMVRQVSSCRLIWEHIFTFNTCFSVESRVVVENSDVMISNKCGSTYPDWNPVRCINHKGGVFGPARSTTWKKTTTFGVQGGFDTVAFSNITLESLPFKLDDETSIEPGDHATLRLGPDSELLEKFSEERNDRITNMGLGSRFDGRSINQTGPLGGWTTYARGLRRKPVFRENVPAQDERRACISTTGHGGSLYIEPRRWNLDRSQQRTLLVRTSPLTGLIPY